MLPECLGWKETHLSPAAETPWDECSCSETHVGRGVTERWIWQLELETVSVWRTPSCCSWSMDWLKRPARGIQFKWKRIENLEDSAVKRRTQADFQSQKTINATTLIMHHKPVSRHGVKFPSPLHHHFQWCKWWCNSSWSTVISAAGHLLLNQRAGLYDTHACLMGQACFSTRPFQEGKKHLDEAL